MAWSATKKAIRKDPGTIYVDVEYSDGVRTFTETYRYNGVPESEWIERTVKNRINQLDGVDSTNIETGAVDEPTSDPTLIQLREDIRRMRIVQGLVDAGAIAWTDTRPAAVLDRVKTGLATYWDQIIT